MSRKPKPQGPERAPGPLPSLGKEGIEALASVPLFSELSRHELKRVAESAQLATYTPGSMIVADGAPGGAGFFVLLDGKALVQKNKRTIAMLHAGDFFGEFAVIDGGRRTATVVAESAVSAMRLPRAAFKKVIEAEPKIAWRILEVLVKRMRELDDGVSH